MSTELKPCPFCGSTNIDPAEWSQDDGKSGPGCGDCGALGESVEAWNRRTAPVSAPLDTQALPPGDIWNRGPFEMPTAYSAKLVEQIVAPYAERIRQLERELWCAEVNLDGANEHVAELKRELAERKPASIVTPEFRNLLARVQGWTDGRPVMEFGMQGEAARALIAYIDGRTAGTAPAWQPIATVPMDGSEVLLYLPAPYDRVVKARWFDVWENWIEGEFPDPQDEYCGIGSCLPTRWMPLPAAPSPLNSGKEEAK